jgi:hypothetical protein
MGRTASRPRRWASLLVVLASAAAVLVAAAGRRAGAARSGPAATGSSSAAAATSGPGAATASTASSAAAAASGSSDEASLEASCAIPDQGFGAYRPWRPLPTGRLLLPEALPSGSYDLVLHFHGAEAARKLLAPAGLGVVIAGLDAGEGSTAYEEAFWGPQALDGLLEAVGAELGADPATRPKLRHLVITSWSAGYGAVRQILIHQPWRPSAVVLLDSLHASYAPGGGALRSEELEPFVELARRAQSGETLLFVTHSEIKPPGYASTSETASYLLKQLGAQRRYAGMAPLEGVEQRTSYDRDGLHVRGFTGSSREAHCAQLKMLRPLLRDEVLPALRGRAD